MSRQIVSVEYLNDWLTRSLRDIQDCNKCTISGVKKLQGVDEYLFTRFDQAAFFSI